MKLRELLSIGDLKKGKILTKEIGLDNEVDSAMVLEAIDIENWSRKNQLILTSFYALHDLPEKELENFFVKMRRIGISGLILKTDRFIKMIPEWFIELCFNYEIPLIKITQDISYEKSSIYDLRAFVELSVACLTYVLRCAPTFHQIRAPLPNG